MLYSLTGTIEPLNIYLAIRAIHWMPSALAFLPNPLYFDAIRKLLGEQ